MLDLLVDTPLNPEQHDYVDTMHHSAEGLLCIINDILGIFSSTCFLLNTQHLTPHTDFSKIEAGKLQLQNEPFNPESAIEVVCEILYIMAVTKNIELVFLVHPGVPPILHGDSLRLRQVLMNLVGTWNTQRRSHSTHHPSHCLIIIELVAFSTSFLPLILFRKCYQVHSIRGGCRGVLAD